MKPRRWIVFLGLLLLVCGFVAYQGVRTLEKNRDIERVLIEQISPMLGGAFDVEKARLGFFSVYLTNVSASIPLHAFRVHVRDIKIAISLRRLIATRGDFGQSISKLIFVAPDIEFGGAASPDARSRDSAASGAAFSDGIPVEHVLIKDGSFRLRIREDMPPVTLGKNLSGALADERAGLRFDLKGSLSSRRRNLSITGLLSRRGQSHRLSLRLDRARIRTPLRVPGATITSGVCDGVCELRFTDSLTLETIESSGWVGIENATAGIDGVAEDVDNVHLRASFVDSRLHIDSIAARWGRLAAAGSGVWGLARRDPIALRLRLDGESFNALVRDAPAALSEHILGEGWAEVRLRKEPGGPRPRMTARVGGFSVWGKPVIRCEAALDLERGAATLDSLIVASPDATVRAAGKFDMSKTPFSYSFTGTGAGRAEDIAPELRGSMRTSFQVDGRGDDFGWRARVSADSLKWRGISLGSPALRVRQRRDRVQFASARTDAPVSVQGSVARPFSPSPRIAAHIDIGHTPILALLDRIPSRFTSAFDSVTARATLTGTLPAFEALGTVSATGAKSSGSVKVHVARDSAAPRCRWRLSGRNLRVNNAGVALHANGRLYSDSVKVDSMRIMDRISGDAMISTRGDVWHAEARLRADRLALTALDSVVWGGSGVADRGYLDGTVRLSGSPGGFGLRGRLSMREGRIGGIDDLETDVVAVADSGGVRVRPFVVRKGKHIILSVDTLAAGKTLHTRAAFSKLALRSLFHGVFDENVTVRGLASGVVASEDTGYALRGSAFVPRMSVNGYAVDSVAVEWRMDRSGAIVSRLTAHDSSRTALTAAGRISWPLLAGEDDGDTLSFTMNVQGDLLASVAKYYDSPIGGAGRGVINLTAGANSETWTISEASVSIPSGVLTLEPFVLDEIRDFTLRATIDDSTRLHTHMAGVIRKRPVSISSAHAIPPGYEPLMLGPVNAGVLLVRTPKKGIDVHVPGFMPIGARANVEFGSLSPFEAFAVSGPVERVKLTGRWTVRDVDFTFPFLEEEVLPWPFDPFPYVDWEMDIHIGNRRVSYFYDVGMRKRFLRFAECWIEPGGVVKVRGRDLDKTFRLYGSLRSYRGTVFFGKVFDRNMEVGCEFAPRQLAEDQGYDNLPVIWGSVEALSDSSRFDRIKLTLLTKDPTTGALSEKGRFNEISIRISSNFEEIPGEAEREFYRQAGLRFVTFEGAGGFVSDFGEQYLHRYFLQRLERRLARRIGLDVISFETSIASNYFYYFYNNQFNNLANQWDNLALAHVGVTLGRYFLSDKVFLKWRTELVPSDTLIYPEHSLGFELYPVRNLLFDISSGFYRGEDAYRWNPRASVQLRLPITRLRKALDF
jgi:hypothetical protein